MAHWKKAFPSKFLQTADLDEGPITATIATVGTENVGDAEAGELKLIVSFREGVKRLVCNLTRAEAISEIAGSENTDDWPGTVIYLTAGVTRYQGKKVGCIVVQAPPVVVPDRQSGVTRKVTSNRSGSSKASRTDGNAAEEAPF